MSARAVGERPLPTGPLLDKSRADSWADFAAMLNVSRRNAYRYRHTMPLRVAENLAERLGYLPIEVWGDLYEQAVAENIMWRRVARDFRTHATRISANRRDIREARHERARYIQWVNQWYRHHA